MIWVRLGLRVRVRVKVLVRVRVRLWLGLRLGLRFGLGFGLEAIYIDSVHQQAVHALIVYVEATDLADPLCSADSTPPTSD